MPDKPPESSAAPAAAPSGVTAEPEVEVTAPSVGVVSTVGVVVVGTVVLVVVPGVVGASVVLRKRLQKFERKKKKKTEKISQGI